jgi:phosphatidylinositol alpha-1,6-mannosyltransferase
MKTLLITNDYPPIKSGISTLFYHIWRLLPRGKNLVLTPQVRGGMVFDQKDDAHFTPIRYPHVSARLLPLKLLNFLTQCITVFYIVLHHNIKLVHAGQLLTGGTIGYILKAILRRPYFVWVYGGETTPVYLKNRWRKLFINLLLTHAEKIITISPAVTNEFLSYGIKKGKICEILPGVDTTLFTPEKPAQELIDKHNLSGKVILLTVARLTPRKGQDMTIRALPLVAKKYDAIFYVIVGDGPYKNTLIQIAEDSGVSDRVLFAGSIPDEEIPSYYRLCDIYIMPNREVEDSTDSVEGFGISFLEASASGKPVIGGRSGGAPFAIADGKSGVIVDPTSPEEIASALCDLIKNSKKAKSMGDYGRKRSRSFDWTISAERIKKLHNAYRV